MLIIGYERVSDAWDPEIDAGLHVASQSDVCATISRAEESLTLSKHLASCQPPIDLIVCDEGHRLKSKDNKTTKMFEALRTNRRISM